MELKFKSLLQFTQYFNTESKCSEYLSQMRWGNKPICPHCDNDDKIYNI